jgi:hypothetical protein
MSSEALNPDQSTPEQPEQLDDLSLDKETLKDLEPRTEDQDNVRGGGRFVYTGGCYGPGAQDGGTTSPAPNTAGTMCQCPTGYFG